MNNPLRLFIKIVQWNKKTFQVNDENVGSRSSASSRESTKTEGVLTFHVYPGFSLIPTLSKKLDRLFNTVKSKVYKNDLAFLMQLL